MPRKPANKVHRPVDDTVDRSAAFELVGLAPELAVEEPPGEVEVAAAPLLVPVALPLEAPLALGGPPPVAPTPPVGLAEPWGGKAERDLAFDVKTSSVLPLVGGLMALATVLSVSDSVKKKNKKKNIKERYN